MWVALKVRLYFEGTLRDEHRVVGGGPLLIPIPLAGRYLELNWHCVSLKFACPCWKDETDHLRASKGIRALSLRVA